MELSTAPDVHVGYGAQPGLRPDIQWLAVYHGRQNGAVSRNVSCCCLSPFYNSSPYFSSFIRPGCLMNFSLKSRSSRCCVTSLCCRSAASWQTIPMQNHVGEAGIFSRRWFFSMEQRGLSIFWRVRLQLLLNGPVSIDVEAQLDMFIRKNSPAQSKHLFAHYIGAFPLVWVMSWC